MGKKSKGQLTEGADQMSGRLEELARVIKGWRHLASDVRVDGDRVAVPNHSDGTTHRSFRGYVTNDKPMAST